jgi:hypothetical protein
MHTVLLLHVWLHGMHTVLLLHIWWHGTRTVLLLHIWWHGTRTVLLLHIWLLPTMLILLTCRHKRSRRACRTLTSFVVGILCPAFHAQINSPVVILGHF